MTERRDGHSRLVWDKDEGSFKAVDPHPPTTDRFRRTYAVEIDFDSPFDFAEQDRLACVVLEKLVDDYWLIAREGTMQGNDPMKVVAYPIPTPRR